MTYVLFRASAVCAAGIGGGIRFGEAIWSALPPALRASRTSPSTLRSAS